MAEMPENLQELTDDQLLALAEEIRQEGAKLAADGNGDEDTAKALEALASQMQAINAELEQREADNQVRAERVNAALELLGSPTSDEGEGDETDQGAAPAEAQPAAASTAAAASTPKDPAKRRVPEAPEDPEADPEQEASVTAPASATEVVDALAAQRPATAAPRVETPRRRPNRAAAHLAEVASDIQPRDTSFFTDTGEGFETRQGKRASKQSIAEAIVEKHRRHSKVSGAMDPVVLATATTDFAESEMTHRGDYEHNFNVLERAAQRGQALVASGGNCAPLMPDYDIWDVAQSHNPVEQALPTVGAPRGGIRYVQAPVWTEAQAGVRFTTMAQDEAGYTTQTPAGSTAPKPCVHMTCNNVVECEVDAISQCVTIGNLQYSTFPEQVEVFLDHLAVAFAQAKEVYYLDAIEAGSTDVNFSTTYGAFRTATWGFALAAHAYRKRNRMGPDAPLDILVPDTMIPVLKIDMVNDLNLGLNFIQANEVQVAQELFDRLNLNVHFYYDFSTSYGARRAMQHAQAAGTLNGFPTDFRTFMYAPGTWIRLDGGQLDLGIVRDSSLISVNDLQIFAEEWTQVCKRGPESIQLDITLCPSGAAPSPVTAISCSS